jgi:hypothetical protein
MQEWLETKLPRFERFCNPEPDASRIVRVPAPLLTRLAHEGVNTLRPSSACATRPEVPIIS